MPQAIVMKQPITVGQGILYAVLIAGVVGGGYYLYTRVRANKAEKLTYIEGTPEADAKLLRMAIEDDSWFNIGTNNEAIRRVLRSVPSKEHFFKIENAYNRLYTSSLMRDMKSDLSTSEFEEMLAILSIKPDKGNTLLPVALTDEQYTAWCKRIKAAFDLKNWIFPGTDEDAITAVVLEVPTQTAYAKLEAFYMKTYGRVLDHALQDELEPWEYRDHNKLVESKPK